MQDARHGYSSQAWGEIKQCLERSDVKILRSILVFIETQRWVQKDGDSDEEKHEIYSGDFIISIFRAPLEANELCVDVLQDEVHEAVEFARNISHLAKKAIIKYGTCTSCTLAPNPVVGAMSSSYVSLYSAYHFQQSCGANVFPT